MKIVIAVAVAEDGNWNAVGFQGTTLENLEGYALDPFSADMVAIYHVEVEVELPGPKTIQGKIVRKGKEL